MSNAQATKCPLCKAHGATVTHHQMKHSNQYVCQSCGHIVIKDDAEDYVSAVATATSLQDMAAEARKCSAGNATFIWCRSEVGSASKTYRQECLPLAEALLR